MTTIEKELRYLSEDETRELFEDKINSDEEILWHAGGYFEHGSGRKSNSLFGIIACCAFEAIVIVFGIVEFSLGHSLLPPICAGLFALIFIAVAINSYINLSYPRYYAVTDSKVISCYRGFRGNKKFISRNISDCGSITPSHIKNDYSVSVFPNGASEDMPIVLSGITIEESERVKELLDKLTT